ncbi:HEPN domain-containing protein [Anabaena catenula]|uniref:Apea-like HEPN domain-containing protein n=1 Tax=Anabaena catenula FACHB-362 TaxID=2692877 RepID=A0ABR8J180_9NOST|nr:HEPN domain-containing protein [Anabaena catenula]MBD2691417.1 hypothetical protein [Anabaena catenula FACHB-362]
MEIILNINQKLLHGKIITKKVFQSINFLVNKRDIINTISDIDDFIYHIINHPTDDLEALEFHLNRVSLKIAEVLWIREIFISRSVIESLLFSLIKDPHVNDPIEKFLYLIEDYGLHRPGLVIYPIHSFGILGFGYARFFTKSKAYFLLEDAGIAITPQSNSKEVLYSLLEEIPFKMGIQEKVPIDSIEHYTRSRSLRWLTNNPLLFVRVNIFKGGYYENQFLLIIKLKIAKSLILMLSVLGKTSEEFDGMKKFSSSKLNNFETLDIKHYLVFQVGLNNEQNLDGFCVPINVNRSGLAELSSLKIELYPNEWQDKTDILQQVESALRKVESGYISNCINFQKNRQETVKSRVYRKIFDSIKYFERSFRDKSEIEDSIVNLAISFECLLTDFYAKGVYKRIIRRARIALESVPNFEIFYTSVDNLYTSRSQIVHLGRTVKTITVS